LLPLYAAVHHREDWIGGRRRERIIRLHLTDIWGPQTNRGPD
jgi:hypothetical protein